MTAFVKDINFKTMENKWISVKDEPPKESKEYLCIFIGWDDMRVPRVLEYDITINEWSDWNGLEYTKVILWQEIEIPKN